MKLVFAQFKWIHAFIEQPQTPAMTYLQEGLCVGAVDYLTAISQKGGKKGGTFMLPEVTRRSNQVRQKAAEWLSSFRAAVSIFYSSFFFISQPRCDRASEQNIFFNTSQGSSPLNFAQLLLFFVLKRTGNLTCKLHLLSVSKLAKQPSKKRAQQACFTQKYAAFL